MPAAVSALPIVRFFKYEIFVPLFAVHLPFVIVLVGFAVMSHPPSVLAPQFGSSTFAIAFVKYGDNAIPFL